jgi:hypothetical protein
VVGIGSGHRPNTPVNKPERESITAPSVPPPNGGRGLPSSARAPKSSDRLEQQGGHYQGITFEDILPAHLITNAPPPVVEQPKRSSTQHRNQAPGPETKTSPIADPPLPSIKRSYTPMKRPGGKFRFRDTARALMRSFTSAKRNSRGRGSYEPV